MRAPDPRRYVGTVIGDRYAVDGVLGRGGFSWVLRAHGLDAPGLPVAIKVLRSEARVAAMRFARETRVLAALPENPHVAAYIDEGRTEDGWPFLVLEYVDGVTLQEGLERCMRLPQEKAVTFVAELCEAFAGLHQLGVAHRDVKPENILIANTGGIKLIDFGLIRDAQGILKLLEEGDPVDRRVFTDELDRRILAGTPEYMAPEQFSDAAARDLSQARTDTWSDVFSIGVILYQLLAGRLPFPMRKVPPDEFPRELLAYMRWRTRLGDEDLPPCSDASPAVQSILVKALRVDPRRRHIDARALRSDLLRYLTTGEGIDEREVTHTEAINLSMLEGSPRGSRAPESPRRAAMAPTTPPSGGAPTRAGRPNGARNVPTANASAAPAKAKFVHAKTLPQLFLDDDECLETTRTDHTRLAKRKAAAARWIDAPTLQEPPWRVERRPSDVDRDDP